MDIEDKRKNTVDFIDRTKHATTRFSDQGVGSLSSAIVYFADVIKYGVDYLIKMKKDEG